MKSDQSKMEPTTDAVNALNELSKDPKNIVIIISPSSMGQLIKIYSKKAPNLGLAAENGFFWRWNSKDKKDSDWNQLIQLDDFVWIKQVRLIMEMYNEKTDGAYIEEKQSSIIWNFKNADFEYGQMLARELHQYILNVFQNLPIDVVASKHTLQVRPQELTDVKLIRTLLEQELAKQVQDTPIDFILYIGDDPQTENCFKYLSRVHNKQQKLYKHMKKTGEDHRNKGSK